jgi:tRNA threonylcarbamoyladenosine biosynthesis protein TsaB
VKVLGIETATALCGIGLSGDEGFIADYRLLRKYIHEEHITEAIEKVLKGAGLSVKSLDGIAVSIGPGSFTGLRIGLGVAKGLAFGLDRPLIAVPTMDGLMSQIPEMSEWACVMLIARRDEIYQGLYRWNSCSWKQTEPFRVIRVEEIAKELPDSEILFIGEGVSCYREIIQEKIKKPRFLPLVYSLPSGYGVAEKGQELLQAGESAEIDTLVPLYLKRFQGVE